MEPSFVTITHQGAIDYLASQYNRLAIGADGYSPRKPVYRGMVEAVADLTGIPEYRLDTLVPMRAAERRSGTGRSQEVS